MSAELVVIDVPSSLDAVAIERLVAQVAALSAGQVAVLRGSAEVFCRGMDFSAARTVTADELRHGLTAYADLLLAVRSAPCSIIAAVEGGTFGGGVGLIAACDLVIAGSTARFGLPEALHGFYPAIVFAALSERMAPQKQRQLALLCESIDAQEALNAGLVDLTVEPQDFERTVQRQWRRLRRAHVDGVLGIKRHAAHLDALGVALMQGVEITLAALLAPGVRERLAEEASA